MTDKEKRELKDGVISIFKRFNIFDHTATIGGLRDDILRYINSLQEEPVSVWHDVSEEPKPNMELICVGQYGNPIVLSSNSNSFKERYISKWAYFNDLLNLSNIERTVKDWKEEPVSEEPKYKGGDILYKINDGSKIEIIDIVADQYKFECGDEYPHYEFFGYIEHNYSKNPVSNDLEEAMQHNAPDNIGIDDLLYWRNGFITGAQWQKKQIYSHNVVVNSGEYQSTLERYFKEGETNVREQMMKSTTEAT